MPIDRFRGYVVHRPPFDETQLKLMATLVLLVEKDNQEFMSEFERQAACLAKGGQLEKPPLLAVKASRGCYYKNSEVEYCVVWPVPAPSSASMKDKERGSWIRIWAGGQPGLNLNGIQESPVQ